MAVPERAPRPKFYFEPILTDMREAYLGDTRPWIVGFSGGKDSTMVVQFVYYMLANLPPADRHKPVYVLASDTRVETPAISGRIRRELGSLAAAAERDGLPISTQIVYPKLNDTFWVSARHRAVNTVASSVGPARWLGTQRG